MMDYVLELENINKSFGGIAVLKDVDFKLKRGSTHALVGGNGAGKSTLMKILTGIYFCDSGTIKLNGQKVDISNYEDARKAGISLIFQELSLIPTLTVTENIFLNKELKNGIYLDHKLMKRKTEELLESMGIQIDVDETIENLDVGYCQLIEIAKALSENSNILVMDEPTASLSEKETEILYDIIEKLKEKGVSIVYISHRMNEIFKIADEISVLCNGKMVATKVTSEYTMELLVQDMMGNNEDNTMQWKDRTTPIGKNNILEVSNLQISSIVKDLSFEVKEGEVVGIAGLMGSGRTETLETIFGLRQKSSGKIKFDEKTINYRSNRQAINDGIALVPEDRRRQGLVLKHNLKDNMILNNLKHVQKYKMIKHNLVNATSEKAIDKFNIKTESASTFMFNLSGGNQQKVVIAKWINRNPKLLLLDEPTAGVDIGSKVEILDIIRKYVAEGGSVIFVSSELSEMMSICDRIIVLHDGIKTGEFSHSELESEEVLQLAIQN